MEWLGPDELPPGHRAGFTVDVDHLDGIPEGVVVSICRRVEHGHRAGALARYGMPIIDRCRLCRSEVWRSPRSPKDLFVICEMCLTERVPGVDAEDLWPS